jgi:hypothetical protein
MKKRMIRIFTVLMFVLCMTGNLNAQNMTGDDALSLNTDLGGAVWSGPVTDDEKGVTGRPVTVPLR